MRRYRRLRNFLLVLAATVVILWTLALCGCVPPAGQTVTGGAVALQQSEYSREAATSQPAEAYIVGEPAAPPSPASEWVAVPLPDGQVFRVPSWWRISVAFRGSTSRPAERWSTSAGTSTGASSSATGAEVHGTVTGSPPELSLGAVLTGKAGGISQTVAAVGKRGPGIVFIGGCVVVALGIVVAVWLQQWWLGAALALAGVAACVLSVVYESASWLFVALAAAGAAGLAGLLLWYAYQRGWLAVFARGVVSSVEEIRKTDKAAAERVTASVAPADPKAARKVRKVVNRIKASQGYPVNKAP